MLINSYSGNTGEFTGAVDARESPNEPGVFLIPAFATTKDLPTEVPDGSVALYVDANGSPPINFNDGNWEIKIDRRGPYWQTVDAQPFYLSEIGVEAAQRGLTDKEPVGVVKWNGEDWVADGDTVIANAKATRNGLLSSAALRIAPLSDAQDLNIATPAEISLLTQWRQYRVDLSRIETQAGFPLDITWPIAPTSAGCD